jgi:hypothetical protein
VSWAATVWTSEDAYLLQASAAFQDAKRYATSTCRSPAGSWARNLSSVRFVFSRLRNHVAISVQTSSPGNPRPAQARRCPALGAGKSLERVRATTPMRWSACFYAAALYVVGGPMEPIGLAGAMC